MSTWSVPFVRDASVDRLPYDVRIVQKRKVLFLCTGNACRSQMAEAMLRHLGGDSFEALSAGSAPAGFIHPLAEEVLEAMDIPLVQPRSKSWDEFADVAVDVVITVCDNAAGETCPVWPGDPLCAHWPLPDPSYHPGTAQERSAFAMQVAGRLRAKIQALVDLDWSAGRNDVKDRLRFLGEI